MKIGHRSIPLDCVARMVLLRIRVNPRASVAYKTESRSTHFLGLGLRFMGEFRSCVERIFQASQEAFSGLFEHGFHVALA